MASNPTTEQPGTTTITNRSGLRPLGRAVLVKMYEPTQPSSLIHIPDMVKERNQMLEQRAVVIEVGPASWNDEPAPRAKPGDKVIVTRFAGYVAVGPADGELYRLVNDRDIFCAITEEK